MNKTIQLVYWSKVWTCLLMVVVIWQGLKWAWVTWVEQQDLYRDVSWLKVSIFLHNDFIILLFFFKCRLRHSKSSSSLHFLTMLFVIRMPTHSSFFKPRLNKIHYFFIFLIFDLVVLLFTFILTHLATIWMTFIIGFASWSASCLAFYAELAN